MVEKIETATQDDERNQRRTLVGVVTSDKMQKSCRVEIPRQIRHPRYGKIIRRRTVGIAHDENNVAKVGDTVEIMSTRPISRTKNWRLVSVMKRSATAKIEQTVSKPS